MILRHRQSSASINPDTAIVLYLFTVTFAGTGHPVMGRSVARVIAPSWWKYCGPARCRYSRARECLPGLTYLYQLEEFVEFLPAVAAIPVLFAELGGLGLDHSVGAVWALHKLLTVLE